MNVLFVCRGNVARSQIAEGYFKKLFPEHKAKSAGTSAKEYSLYRLSNFENISKCMREVGINISNKKPKQLTGKMLEKSDLIIWMSQDDPYMYTLGKKRVVKWKVPDPAGQSYDFYCKVRSCIEGLVKGLESRLN